MNTRVMNTKTILLLTATVLVAGGIVFLFSLRHQSKLSNQNLPAYRQHQNQDAKTGFTYPSSFGVAQEVFLEPSLNSLVTAGKALKITFSTMPDAWLIVASTDFAMFKENAYTGGDHISALSCAHPDTFDTDGNGCTVKTVNGKIVLVKTEYLADEGVYNLLRTFSLDVPSGNYRGLKITQSFLALYDQLNQQISEEERKKILQRYAPELLSGISQDSGLSSQLRDVDRIVQTLSVST